MYQFHNNIDFVGEGSEMVYAITKLNVRFFFEEDQFDSTALNELTQRISGRENNDLVTYLRKIENYDLLGESGDIWFNKKDIFERKFTEGYEKRSDKLTLIRKPQKLKLDMKIVTEYNESLFEMPIDLAKMEIFLKTGKVVQQVETPFGLGFNISDL